MAAGADRRRVISEEVRSGLGVTAAGLALGGLFSLWTVRLVEMLLFGVAPDDPVTLVTAAGALSQPRSSRASCPRFARLASIR